MRDVNTGKMLYIECIAELYQHFDADKLLLPELVYRHGGVDRRASSRRSSTDSYILPDTNRYDRELKGYIPSKPSARSAGSEL